MRLITVKRSRIEIGSSSVPPLLEVPLDRRHCGLRGGVEPAVRTLLEIDPQCRGAGRSSGMDRCEIESHRFKKVGFATPTRVVAEFDFSGICGNTPEDEPVTVADLEKRIRSAVFAVRQVKEARSLGFPSMRPRPGRRHQRLGFAQHLTAAPEGNRDKAGPSKAAAALDARAETNVFGVFWQTRNQRIRDLSQRNSFRIAGNFFPEFLRLVVGGERHPTLGCVVLKPRKPLLGSLREAATSRHARRRRTLGHQYHNRRARLGRIAPRDRSDTSFAPAAWLVLRAALGGVWRS